jgi:hypothetical protein
MGIDIPDVNFATLEPEVCAFENSLANTSFLTAFGVSFYIILFRKALYTTLPGICTWGEGSRVSQPEMNELMTTALRVLKTVKKPTSAFALKNP